MNRLLAIGLLALAVVTVFVAGNSVFDVRQTQQAIVLRLGAPNRLINVAGQDDAGLQLKLPFVETVARFDRQSQALEIDRQDMRASDQQHLVVDALLRYRIVDPLAYMRSLNDEQAARAQLTPLIAGALREQIGAAKSGDVITGGAGPITAAALAQVAARVKAAKMGIQLIDLSLKRIDLPAADAAAVYDRMKTQRQQDVLQIKTQGDLDVLAVRANGAKTAEAITAAANDDAGRIMGEGDAKRAEIYAQTYGRDPQFADFYRRMQAYEQTMESGDKTITLSTDSEFLKYFKSGPGK
jgi:membrane protease subunit HflC